MKYRDAFALAEEVNANYQAKFESSALRDAALAAVPFDDSRGVASAMLGVFSFVEASIAARTDAYIDRHSA